MTCPRCGAPMRQYSTTTVDRYSGDEYTEARCTGPLGHVVRSCAPKKTRPFQFTVRAVDVAGEPLAYVYAKIREAVLEEIELG